MSAVYYKKDRFRRQSNYSTDIKNDKPNGDYSELDSNYSLPNSDYGTFSNENSSGRTVKNLDYCIQPPPRRVVNIKGINISTNKKRNIKDKLIYQSIINNFILSKSNLLDGSIEIYKLV